MKTRSNNQQLPFNLPLESSYPGGEGPSAFRLIKVSILILILLNVAFCGYTYNELPQHWWGTANGIYFSVHTIVINSIMAVLTVLLRRD